MVSPLICHPRAIKPFLNQCRIVRDVTSDETLRADRTDGTFIAYLKSARGRDDSFIAIMRVCL